MTHLYYSELEAAAGLVTGRAVLYTFAPFVSTRHLSYSMYTVFSKPEETRGDWYRR